MNDLFADLPRPGEAASFPTSLPALIPAGEHLADDYQDLLPPLEMTAAQPGKGEETGADRLLGDLNPQQQKAVAHVGTPLLVVAGAGSGKTRVLTRRVAHLLASGRARPWEILAITFTNKAAAEMRERVAALVGPAASRMWVSTFHSACVRILRREYEAAGLRSTFSIYDSADSLRLLTMVAKDAELDPKRFAPKALARRISDLKNELIPPEQFAQSAPADQFSQAVAEVYLHYQRRLRQANALDFDDLIGATVKLLTTNPGVAEHYHRRFRHILVDEYQDTNHAQYVLVRALVGGENAPHGPAELTVVGDSDQSIYAFRGATIRNIEEFESDYPQAATVMLEQNYRSTQNILTAANAVIARNSGRRAKKLWTDQGGGPKIVLDVAESEHDEARFIVREIDELITQGTNYGEIALFYRTNAQSRVLEELFIRAGIPYRVVGGTRFYERREIKDAIAYLRSVANPDDTINLRRVLNTPRRGIGAKAEDALVAHGERHGISFGQVLADATQETVTGEAGERGVISGITVRARNGAAKFWQLLEQLRELEAAGSGPAEILDTALAESGYLAILQASEDPQDASRVENLAELHAVAQEFHQSEPEGTLADFLERVSLVADSDQVPGHDETGQVTLMTVHTAKGLEFPVVFVTGMEDGTFPHARSRGNEFEMSEERRLAYVAITRARRQLYLTRAMVRTSWGMSEGFPASPFLEDIPPELTEVRRDGSHVGFGTFAGAGGYGRPQWGGGASAGVGPGTSRSQGASGSRGRQFRAGDDDFAPPVGAGQARTGRLGRVDDAADRTAAVRGGSSGTAPVADFGIEVGDRVLHDVYGLGTVLELQGKGQSQSARIDFGNGSVKRLVLRFAPVSKI